MDRRNFLGSLIGSVAALVIAPDIILPKSPFYALPETAEWQRLNPTLPWRMMWKDEVSGLWLQGGAVQTTRMRELEDGVDVDLWFEPVTTSGTIYIHPTKLRIFNESDPLMVPHSSPFTMLPGDCLSFNNTRFTIT